MVKLLDTLIFDQASVRKTADGYLVASALCARTGIQRYLGSEVGRPDKAFVDVYRPPETVFDKDSLASYAHKPLTNDHPSDAVNAGNWKTLAVGQIGDEVARDGEMVRVPMVLMDASAIADVEAGKRELSLGYSCDLDFTDGQTAEGLHYDAIQKNIRANHLAIVGKARGGPTLKIGDDDVPEIKLNKIVIDGFTFEVNDAAVEVINKLKAQVADGVKALADAKAAGETATAAHAAAVAAKDAEIATLKGKVLDEAGLDAAIKAKDAVAATAKKIMGDTFKADGKSVADIRKEVVLAKIGDAAKSYTADQFTVSFDTLAAHLPKAAVSSAAPLAAAIAGSQVADGENSAEKALQASIARDAEAWKNPGKAA